jgi:hypothetical protein
MASQKKKQTNKEKIEKELSEILPTQMPVPLSEYQFMYSRRWAFDWAIPSLKIAIEYDGIVFRPEHQRGGHQTPKGMANDSEKRNEAQIRGWIVIIVNQTTMKDGTFADQLERAIKVRRGDIRYE